MSAQITLGSLMSVGTFMWFSFIAYVFTHRWIKTRIDRIQKYVVKTMGALMIGLGIRVALSD